MLYASELTWAGQKGVEGEYQRAINRMARSTLGAFRSTPQGTLAGESGLTPARLLLDHRQARFAQRLLVRPQDGGGPEEILERDSGAIVSRLRAASGVKPREMVEPQVWSEDKPFPRQCVILEEGPALDNAKNWYANAWETIWTNGSRLDDGRIGAARAWSTQGGSWEVSGRLASPISPGEPPRAGPGTLHDGSETMSDQSANTTPRGGQASVVGLSAGSVSRRHSGITSCCQAMPR